MPERGPHDRPPEGDRPPPGAGRPEPGPERRPPGPTRGEIVRGITEELEAHGFESPRVEAERIVAAALGIGRAELEFDAGAAVPPERAAAVGRSVARRVAREPLQHVEGSAAFRHLVLVSDRRALIPRPETEQLVDRIAEWLDGRVAARALDIGTGSGAIALALLDEGLAESAVGLDVSPEALEQAAENARRMGLEARLTLRRCPPAIWSAVSDRPPFDLIVSNPPYVASGELAGLPEEIREHEPRVALEGGEDGLDIVRLILPGAARALVPGGGLFLEIAPGQEGGVRALLEGSGAWERVRIDADLAGRPRFASAVRAPGGADRVAPLQP